MSEEDNERKEERRHMLKGIFAQMKNWYCSAEIPDTFRGKYGAYPLFWQDLETWPHTNIMKKIYLSVTDRKEAGLQPLDVLEFENSLIVKEEISASLMQEDSGIIEEKSAVVNHVASIDLSTSSSSSVGIDDGETKKRKKNRWGVAPGLLSSEQQQHEQHLSVEIKGSDSTADLSTVAGEYGTDLSEAAGNSINKKARKSRWSVQDDPSLPVSSSSSALSAAVAAANAVAGYNTSTLPFTLPIQPPPQTQEQLQQTIVLKMQLQQINERMLTVAQDAARIDADPDRPPSPPPKYDSQGKRTNTRVIRMRDELMHERSKIAEQLMKLNPAFATPLDMMRSKPIRKIPIPASQVPNQSFIGLIIGPRGNTQKRMEQETNCKISIKGKGMRGSANLPGEEEEDLHVFITGEDEAKVEQAAQLVMELLQPRNEEAVTQHKEKQLRELALINGTLREDEYCPVCGEKGHKQYECPARIKSFKAAGVKCSICGDGSHPTRDCPLKQSTVVGEGVLDSEYDSLMAELNGTASSSSSKNSNTSSTTLLSSSSSNAASANGNGGMYGSSATVGGTGTVEATVLPVVVPLQPPKRQQTIIHVTTVMTGSGAPPMMLAPSTPSLSMATSMSTGSKLSLPIPTLQTPSLLTTPTATPYSYPSYMQPVAQPLPQQQQPYLPPMSTGQGTNASNSVPTSASSYGYYSTSLPTSSSAAAVVPPASVYNPSTGSYSYYPPPTSSPYQPPVPVPSTAYTGVPITAATGAAMPWNYPTQPQQPSASPRVPLPVQPPPPMPYQPAPPS